MFTPVIPHFQDQITPQGLWAQNAQYGVPHDMLFTPSHLYKDMAGDRRHHIMNTFLHQPDVPIVANKKVVVVTQTSDSVSHWPTQEQQLEIDRQLPSHLQEIEVAKAKAQNYDRTLVEPTYVGSTQTNTESKWMYSPQPAKVTKRIQTQTQFQEKPQAWTKSYNRLLNKANEEKNKVYQRSKQT